MFNYANRVDATLSFTALKEQIASLQKRETELRILHILDHSLPLHSGYTFRTRAILKAQAAKGWAVAGVTGTRHTAGGPAVEHVEGLTFYRTKPSSPLPSPLAEIGRAHV